MNIQFREIFAALEELTYALPNITGYDLWRQKTGRISLADTDPTLLEECVRPPSKLKSAFCGAENSAWNALHFTIMMPALQQLGERASQSNALNQIPINHTQAGYYFKPFGALKAHIKQAREWRDAISEILSDLPQSPESLPENLQRLLQAEVADNPANHIVGRLLQSYYAEQTGDYTEYGLPAFAQEYCGGGNNIFTRNQIYLRRLASCPLPASANGDVYDALSAADILKTYSWFSCPTVVEMILPNLEGAAFEAAGRLTDFLDDIRDDKRIDFTTFTIDETTLDSLRKNTDLLDRIGRISALTGLLNTGTQNDTPLRVFAKKLWNEEQRHTVWGHPNAYTFKEPSSIAAIALQMHLQL